MNTPERLRPVETTETFTNERVSTELSLEPARVEALFVERGEMLSTIEQQLPSPLPEALRIKIANEKKRLLAFVETDTQIRAAQEKEAALLDKRYFVKAVRNPAVF